MPASLPARIVSMRAAAASDRRTGSLFTVGALGAESSMSKLILTMSYCYGITGVSSMIRSVDL